MGTFALNAINALHLISLQMCMFAGKFSLWENLRVSLFFCFIFILKIFIGFFNEGWRGGIGCIIY